jgi:hypothetical protein
VRLVEAYGAVELVDARAQSALVRAYWAQGYDLDQGMIVVIDGTVHHGAQAAMMLARMASNDTIIDKAFHSAMSQGQLARLAYPLLKIARRIALILKGRKGLANPISSAAPPHR